MGRKEERDQKQRKGERSELRGGRVREARYASIKVEEVTKSEPIEIASSPDDRRNSSKAGRLRSASD